MAENSFEQRIDPELLEAFRAAPARNWTGDLAEARAQQDAEFEQWKDLVPVIEGVTVSDEVAPGVDDRPDVSVRVYLPDDLPDEAPSMLFIHGGGLVFGSVEQYDFIARIFATSLGCRIVSVEYRLAPEHPFPAGLDDCISAIHYVAASATDPSRVGIGGVSAGGNLAAATALYLRDQGGPTLCMQMLTYPMLDDRCDTPSALADTDPRVWNLAANRRCWSAYLGDDPAMGPGTHNVSIYAAPARAVDLSGLPPALVDVGTCDLFVDESIEYAQRLLRDGVPTELYVVPGVFHGGEAHAPSAAVSARMIQTRFAAATDLLHRPR